MSARHRLIVQVTMGVLVLAALAFAIIATRESSSGGSDGASSGGAGAPQSAPASPGGFEGAAVPGSPEAPPIELFDQYGRPASLRALRGSPVALTFLYTRCGPPCDVIAQQLRGALDELRRPVPVLLVSVDPGGDTPVAVRRFLARVSLSGRVYYLTGPRPELEKVWREYRVRPPGARGASAFAAAATVLLIDAAGRERVIFGAEQLTPEALAHDIQKLQHAGT